MDNLNLEKYLTRGIRKRFPIVKEVNHIDTNFNPYTFYRVFKIHLRTEMKLHKTYEFELKMFISELMDFTYDNEYVDREIKLEYV